MSTWTQLCDELSECERQIIAIRLKAEERVHKENERLALVERKRDECITAHRQSIKAAVEDYEQQIANVTGKAEQQTGAVVRAQADAERRTREAAAATEAAEQRTRELEREMLQLRRALDRTLLEEEQRSQEVVCAADMAVKQREEETNRIVQDTARYTSEVQDGAVEQIELMHGEHQGNIRETEERSVQRSRYKELYNAALGHTSRDLSPAEFGDAKADLVRGWYDDWVKTTSNTGQRTTLADGLKLEGMAEQPLSPSDPCRPRSVVRARQRAEELKQRQEQQCMSPAVVWH